jgi:hypothetical protein
MRSIEFYRTARGTCPVEEFLDALADKQAQKVAWVLRLVERLDRVPEQYLSDSLAPMRFGRFGPRVLERVIGFSDSSTGLSC